MIKTPYNIFSSYTLASSKSSKILDTPNMEFHSFSLFNKSEIKNENLNTENPIKQKYSEIKSLVHKNK